RVASARSRVQSTFVFVEAHERARAGRAWRMTPISACGGSDGGSRAADNTTAFNCRCAVAPGAKRWSVHAYREAVDGNPGENPYLESGRAYCRPPGAGTAIAPT